MTQVGVALTDYGLVIECLVFTTLLAPYRLAPSTVPAWFMVFFSSTAVAAITGGTVHGFFRDISSVGHRVLWPTTMIATGVTALAGVRIAAALQLTAASAVWINRCAVACFVLYCIVVMFLSQLFVIAILGYLPATLFVGWAYFATYRRGGRPASLMGVLGICVLLLAAMVQQAKLDINPQYFNHNVLYHVLAAVGLFLLFLAARDSGKSWTLALDVSATRDMP